MIDAIVRASVGGTVAVAVVWAIGRLLPQLSPAVRATLWWLAAAKFLVSLVWMSALEIPVLPAATINVAQSAAALSGAAFAVSGAASARVPWNLQTWAVFVWIAGAAIAVVIGMRQWRRASAIVRASRPAPADLHAVASDLAGRLGITRTPAVLESELIDTPLVTGLRRPTVVVPVSFHSLRPDQQRMVLCHELAHVKRADLSLGAIPALAERIFFFHPLVHVAAREYSIWREAACDRDVLDALDAAPDEYGRLLVDLGVSRPRAGLAAAGASRSSTTLKRRLSMLTESQNRPKYSRAITLAAIGVAAITLVPLTLSARSVALAPEAQVPVQEARAAEKQEAPAMKIVLFGEKTRLRGERADVAYAMQYRTGTDKLVWYRIGESEYILRDQDLFNRVDDAWTKALAAVAAADAQVKPEEARRDPVDPDLSFVQALLTRFADGGRAEKIK